MDEMDEMVFKGHQDLKDQQDLKALMVEMDEMDEMVLPAHKVFKASKGFQDLLDHRVQ